MEYVGFDAHKHYTLASVAQADGRLLREEWIERERGRSRPSWRAASSDETGRCAGGDPRPSEAHDERDGGRGPGPRQCLEQDRLSTENVKPLRASVTEGDKEKGGTKITA